MVAPHNVQKKSLLILYWLPVQWFLHVTYTIYICLDKYVFGAVGLNKVVTPSLYNLKGFLGIHVLPANWCDPGVQCVESMFLHDERQEERFCTFM